MSSVVSYAAVSCVVTQRSSPAQEEKEHCVTTQETAA